MRIPFETRTEPGCNQKEFFPTNWIPSCLPEVVVSQAELSNRDGVVLQAYAAVVVELRNSRSVEGSVVVGLLGEGHVVLPQFRRRCTWILSRCLMPEREMAVAAEQVGAEDSSIVAETWQE